MGQSTTTHYTCDKCGKKLKTCNNVMAIVTRLSDGLSAGVAYQRGLTTAKTPTEQFRETEAYKEISGRGGAPTEYIEAALAFGVALSAASQPSTSINALATNFLLRQEGIWREGVMIFSGTERYTTKKVLSYLRRFGHECTQLATPGSSLGNESDDRKNSG